MERTLHPVQVVKCNFGLKFTTYGGNVLYALVGGVIPRWAELPTRSSHHDLGLLLCYTGGHLEWVYSHTLSGVVSLVDPDQPVCQLKHVVTKTDDDKLGVLCTLL